MNHGNSICLSIVIGSRVDRFFKLFFFLIYFFEGQLIYNFVLFSDVQQSDSVIHILTFSFSYSFPLWWIIEF